MNRAGTINGCAVSLQRSPDKDGNWLTTSCELNSDSAWKCRFAMSYMDPMEPGMDCAFRDCGECLCLFAKLDALHMALAMINDETVKINREIENVSFPFFSNRYSLQPPFFLDGHASFPVF